MEIIAAGLEAVGRAIAAVAWSTGLVSGEFCPEQTILPIEKKFFPEIHAPRFILGKHTESIVQCFSQ